MLVRLTGTEPRARDRPGSWSRMYFLLATPMDSANLAVSFTPTRYCIITDGTFSE